MSTRSKSTRKKDTAAPAAKKPKPEKTAKWTSEEHEAFLEGYQKHGDDWKKVATKIKTRTMAQTRAYGEKHVEEAEKDQEETPTRKARAPRGSKTKSSPKKEEKKTPRGRRSKRQKEEDEAEDDAEDEAEAVTGKTADDGSDESVEAEEPKKEAAKKDEEKKSEKKTDENIADEKKEPPKKKAKRTPTEKKAATPAMGSDADIAKGSTTPAQTAVQAPLTPAVLPVGGAATSPGGTASSFYTDRDILLPMNESVTSRPANREYLELLKANCVIFHSLPSTEQAWFVRNFCHFITSVRGRRWIGFHHWSGYRPLVDALPAVAAEFRLDPLKRAAFQFHPLWLLGEHDPGNMHKGKPFAHRKVDGAWKSASVKDVREILTAEGPKNLLLLPPSIKMDDPKPEDEKVDETAESTKPAAEEGAQADV